MDIGYDFEEFLPSNFINIVGRTHTGIYEVQALRGSGKSYTIAYSTAQLPDSLALAPTRRQGEIITDMGGVNVKTLDDIYTMSHLDRSIVKYVFTDELDPIELIKCNFKKYFPNSNVFIFHSPITIEWAQVKLMLEENYYFVMHGGPPPFFIRRLV